MKDTLIITIPSHPKYLSVVRAVTAKIGQLYEIDEAVVEDIKLAIDEACTNIIKHAYKGVTSEKIILKYKISQKTFKVIIEDSGSKSNIDVMKGRSLEDVRPGGLGIHLINRVFDVFEFDEKKRKGNRLKLVKYIKAKT
jgi:serine/threonine-protein kinase RsbW